MKRELSREPQFYTSPEWINREGPDLGQWPLAKKAAMECRLLCEVLQRKQGEQLSLLRKASYFRGWKHSKAKKGGKRIWFATAFELLPWEKVEAGL